MEIKKKNKTEGALELPRFHFVNVSILRMIHFTECDIVSGFCDRTNIIEVQSVLCNLVYIVSPKLSTMAKRFAWFTNLAMAETKE